MLYSARSNNESTDRLVSLGKYGLGNNDLRTVRYYTISSDETTYGMRASSLNSNIALYVRVLY